MINVANENGAGRAWLLRLCVAAQAEIRIALDEHLPVDRAVRVVADRAPFAQGLMLEDKRAGLLAMALLAAFVLPGHGQPDSRLENIAAMRVVALHTVHVPFNDLMMIGQAECSLNVQMALETRRRVVARIDDEFCVAAAFDVLAAGAVTGFAARAARQRCAHKVDLRMRTGGEFPDNLRMAIHTSLVADVMSAGNFQWRHYLGWRGGTGIQKGDGGACRHQCHEDDCRLLQPHPVFRCLEHEGQGSAG